MCTPVPDFLGILFGIVRCFLWSLCGEILVQRSLPLSDSFFDWISLSKGMSFRKAHSYYSVAFQDVDRFEILTVLNWMLPHQKRGLQLLYGAFPQHQESNPQPLMDAGQVFCHPATSQPLRVLNSL